VHVESLKERTGERKRLTARALKGPMKVVPALSQLGKAVFADGAISKKHKELMALAVAVSQNCFE
jgi:alkylhydroperoxidase/carboxymuconolactone decarboxylase family protein YurZ